MPDYTPTTREEGDQLDKTTTCFGIIFRAAIARDEFRVRKAREERRIARIEFGFQVVQETVLQDHG